jgi:hypothetical protein
MMPESEKALNEVYIVMEVRGIVRHRTLLSGRGRKMVAGYWLRNVGVSETFSFSKTMAVH